MSEPRDVLLGRLADFNGILRTTVQDAVLDGMPAMYRERLLRASAEGAEQLALAATGDEQAVEELRLIAARMALWTFAGCEHARQATVRAWRRWLFEATEALVEVAIPILEAGFRALVESGLQSLVD